MNSTATPVNIDRHLVTSKECIYNINFHRASSGGNKPIIHFHLPVPGSCSTSEEESTVHSPPKVNFHLPIPGSTSTSSTYNDSPNSEYPPPSQHHKSRAVTNKVLSQLQFGLLFSPENTRTTSRRKHNNMSDDESSDFEQIASVDSDEEQNCDTSNDAEDDVDVGVESNPVENFDYTALAGLLLQDNNTTFNFSTEEEKLIKESSVNTFRYGKSKEGIEKRFFDTIEQYGGDDLKKLVEVTVRKQIPERRFYVVLRGRRNEHKRIILSKCLLLIAIKWRNMSKRDFGKHYQPDTWSTMLRTLFAIFRAKGITFKHTRDFNGNGEFHAVLKRQWENEVNKDPQFATGIRTSSPDLDADWKIREKYNAKEFDPFSTSDGTSAYQDRLHYAVFILGRYWLLRGKKEIAFLLWSQVKFLSSIDNGKVVQFVEVVQHFDKGRPLNLKNTTARSVDDIAPRIYPNDNDPLCPVKFLTFFRSLCSPEQERVLCKPYSTEQRKKYTRNKLPYLYNHNLVLGEHSVVTATKEFAERMGFEDWERCTNHSNRKMGISVAVSNGETGIQHIISKTSRHKDANTQKRYFKESNETMKSYNKAILGKHVRSPTKSPIHTKKKCSDEHTNSVLTEKDINDSINMDIKLEERKQNNTYYGESISNNLTNNENNNPEQQSGNMDPPSQIIIKPPPTIPSVIDTHNKHDAASLQSYYGLQSHSINSNQHRIDNYPYMVTPHDTWRAIISQQHLNNVQRNIFVTPSTETLPQDTADVTVALRSISASASNTITNTLQQQVHQLQQQLIQQEKDRAREKMEELQQKYYKAKQEIQQTRHEKQMQDITKHSSLCVLM
ncbi:MAG: hypothetical protein ACOVR6_08160 [Fimbriimonas sp.]